MARSKRSPSPGKCRLCGSTLEKAQMTRHLTKCLADRQSAEAAASGGGGARLFHILAEGGWSKEYWMHLEVPAKARLLDLDAFLRKVWLECCGHMSVFQIGEESYSVKPMNDPFFGVREKSMKAALGDVLGPGTSFSHEYDFGSTTELALKVVSERTGPAPAKKSAAALKARGGSPVKVLARNDPPDLRCSCGEPAAEICGECLCEGPEHGYLCKKCAAKHKCGEEMLLPVVNSPRMGVCGYDGPATEPGE